MSDERRFMSGFNNHAAYRLNMNVVVHSSQSRHYHYIKRQGVGLLLAKMHLRHNLLRNAQIRFTVQILIAYNPL